MSDIAVRAYGAGDIPAMVRIWNEAVEEGEAFPREELFDEESGAAFFASQVFCGVAEHKVSHELLGLYVLHPAGEGRCAHNAGACYAVRRDWRNRHVGEKLVLDSLDRTRDGGYKALLLGTVVAGNRAAAHLFESLGFGKVGTIPEGFRTKDGHFEDSCSYYHKIHSR